MDGAPQLIIRFEGYRQKSQTYGRIWVPLREIFRCLVSVGTGVPAIKTFNSGMLEVARSR